MGAGLELVGLRTYHRRIQFIHATAADRRNAPHVQLHRESTVEQSKYLYIYLFPTTYPMFTDNVVFFSYSYSFIVDHADYSDILYSIILIDSIIFNYEYADIYFITDYVVFFYFVFIIDYVDLIGAESKDSLAHRGRQRIRESSPGEDPSQRSAGTPWILA